MKTSLTYAVVLVMLLNLLSCTSTRWTVVDPGAIDYNDYSVIQSREFLKEAGRVTPDDPALKLQLLSYTTYEYAEKVLVRRSIQEYRPRPGLVALGLAGAALSVYAANSDVITDSESSLKTITLNSAGGLLALSGFLNMKPVGEPRDTGEEQFLRKTGTILQTDTLRVNSPGPRQADVAIIYGDRMVSEELELPLKSGLLDINLGSTLGALGIRGSDPDSVTVIVEFQDSTYTFDYSLQDILHPFARITAPITPLRNAPAASPENVLAELVEGGQLQIIGSSPDWYKVLYGISETYILREDAEIIWQSSDFTGTNQVVAVPRLPFGSVDVENNIPILRGINEHAMALVIANEHYKGDLPPRTYALRDGKLIQTYLENALGIPEAHIFEIQDMNQVEELSEPLSKIDSMATDSSELFVFLSGYGSVDVQDGEIRLGFIPANEEGQVTNTAIDLFAFMRRIASIPSGKTVVIADIDFNHRKTGDVLTDRNVLLKRPLRQLAEILTRNNSRSAVLYGSEFRQASAVYLSNSGEDKKHRIFPYFVARALQQRHTNMAGIYQFLQRNVSYHARRLHDRAQDPQLFGNISIDLANE